jgi:hypothetical protein
MKRSIKRDVTNANLCLYLVNAKMSKGQTNKGIAILSGLGRQRSARMSGSGIRVYQPRGDYCQRSKAVIRKEGAKMKRIKKKKRMARSEEMRCGQGDVVWERTI